MKWLMLVLIPLFLIACTPDNAPAVQDVYFLPDGHIKVGDVSAGDPPSLLRLLGPPDTTHLNLMACPTTSYRTIKGPLAAIDDAGYAYGFASIDAEDPLCAAH